MKMCQPRLRCWQLAALTVVVALVATVQPSAPLTLTTALIAAWTLSITFYWSSPHANRGGALFLLGAATVLSCGIVLNAWHFTTACGASAANPMLANGDSARTLDEYNALPRSDIFNRSTGYAMVLRVLCAPWGEFSLGAALGLSMLCVLLTAILTGRLTATVCKGICTPGYSMFAGMAVILCNGYILSSGTIILKDAFIGLVCVTYFLICVRLDGCAAARRPCARLAAVGCLCLILAAMVRILVLPLLAIGPMWLLWSHRSSMIRLAGFAMLACMAVCAAVVFAQPTTEHYIHFVDRMLGAGASAYYEESIERRAPLVALIGDYDLMPVWQKLTRLPAVTLCQFLIPFPWNFARDCVYGPMMAVAHIGYPAYLVGLTVLYYIMHRLRELYRRCRPTVATMPTGSDKSLRTINLLLAWGIVVYLAIAWEYSGCVSRYCLQFTPLAAPAVAVTWLKLRHRRSFKVWMTTSCITLIAVLIVCHRLQTGVWL